MQLKSRFVPQTFNGENYGERKCIVINKIIRVKGLCYSAISCGTKAYLVKVTLCTERWLIQKTTILY